MTDKESLLNLIKTVPNGWSKKLKANQLNLYLLIDSNFNGSFAQKTWMWLHDMIDVPRCKMCDNHVQFKNINIGFLNYCSNLCSGRDENVKIKRKKTCQDKFGTDSVFESIEFKKKAQQTSYKKYGVSHPNKSKIVRDKTEETCLREYGFKTPLKNKGVKEKIKKTCELKYGGPSSSCSKEVNEKAKQTSLKEYGTISPLLNENIKKKISNTLNSKYGVSHVSQIPEVKQKHKDHYAKKHFDGSLYARFDYKIPIKVDTTTNPWTLYYKCDDCKNEFSINRYLFYARMTALSNPCTICCPIDKTRQLYRETNFRIFIDSLKPSIKARPLNGKEIDVYFKDKKLGFEFNELYFHSNLFVPNNYHIKKTEIADEKGIRLIHIWEDDWKFKRNIVESKIKNLLGFNSEKIFARKCSIVELSSKQFKEFMNDNHIQGSVASKYKYGLKLNKEIVCAMSFSKPRLALGNKSNKSDEYEMTRFCSKLNCNVIGGASRLMKHFIKTVKVSKIISMADRSWSIGNLYETLGFKFIGYTKPNYHYIIKGKRMHRFNFRKDVLIKKGFDPNKTAQQIMAEQNIIAVYDCGSIRYEYIVKHI